MIEESERAGGVAVASHDSVDSPEGDVAAHMAEVYRAVHRSRVNL
jgi:hypothetical protein